MKPGATKRLLLSFSNYRILCETFVQLRLI
jgi:hypothetical protein